jgi:hypothetical protein
VDVNRDGRGDIVVGYEGNVGIYLQRADGTLAGEQLFAVPSASHFNRKGLSVGDVNSDAWPDVVSVGNQIGSLNVILQVPPPNSPPDCGTAAPEPSVILPANHRLADVHISAPVDPDGDAVTVRATGVMQDEPVVGRTDKTSPDAVLQTGSAVVVLRGERDPQGDGRVYAVDFAATDDRGASCTGTVHVSVPRHRDEAAVGSAAAFDSLAGG